MSTTEDIIGRADVNDLEAILGVTNTDVNELVHHVKDNADCIFTWDYEKGRRPALIKLYEKAKTAQWNGETDLPWDTEVDQEAVVVAEGRVEVVVDVVAALEGRVGLVIGGHRRQRGEERHLLLEARVEGGGVALGTVEGALGEAVAALIGDLERPGP